MPSFNNFQDDRHVFIQPDQFIRTDWIDINLCQLGCRERMDAAAVERSTRRYLQADQGQIWPIIVGHWDGKRFAIDDGRHEYLALLILGKDKIFVAWLETIGDTCHQTQKP